MPQVEDAAPRRKFPFSIRQIRLACGLVLFSYVALHYTNHALGNISVAAMERGLALQKAVWQSAPGAILLYGALLTHMSLGFWALYERRQFRWTRMEATQLALGLCIPFLLTDHVFGTRVSLSLFGTEKGYAEELVKFFVRSPFSGFLQATLLLIVWIYGCIGVYFWLSLKPGFPRVKNLLLSFAVLLPALALLGYAQGGRQTLQSAQDPLWQAEHLTPQHIGTPAQNARLLDYRTDTLVFLAGALAAAFLARGLRRWRENRVGFITLTYPDRSIRARRGTERARGEPHARHSACPCLRRPGPLLHLPDPHPRRRRRPAPGQRGGTGGPGSHRGRPRRPSRLPATAERGYRLRAPAPAAREHRGRQAARPGLDWRRTLCRHHVRRHARIEPAGRKAPAVRHRVHHQPVSQCGQSRGDRIRAESPTRSSAMGCSPCSASAAGRRRPAGRRSRHAPPSPPTSKG